MIITTTGLLESIKLLFGSSLYDSEGFAYKDNRLLKCKNKKISSVKIPEGIEIICDQAFKGLKSLHTVILPSSLKAIGYRAFEGCVSLESIIFPSNLEQIGTYAFLKCSGLKSITLPSGLRKIGDSVFNGCNNLKSIIIPNGGGNLKEIGSSFPENVKEISVYDPEIKLTWKNFSCFVSESDYNKLEPSKATMLIKVPLSNLAIYLRNLEKLAKIENLNYRTPIYLGKNPSGCLQTVVQAKIKVGSGAHVLEIGDKKFLAFAETDTKFELSIYDWSGKEISKYEGLQVDGTLHGVINWKWVYKSDFNPKGNKQIFTSIDEDWDDFYKKESVLNEDQIYDDDLRPSGIIYPTALENYIVEFVHSNGLKLNNSTDSRILEVTQFKITDEKPLELNCYIRVISGEFNPSKLNFIYYYPADIKIWQIKELSQSFPTNRFYFMNIIAYEGMLFNTELSSKYDYEDDQYITSFEWEGVMTKEKYLLEDPITVKQVKMIRTSGKNDSPREVFDLMNDY